MKLINEALQAKNLTLNDLDEELVERINDHKAMVLKYNEACDEYEEEEDDEEVEEVLEQQQTYIIQNEAEIAEDIRSFDEDDEDDDDENRMNQGGRVVHMPSQSPRPVQKPKQKNSAGWLVFGGVVLLVTLGAVNIFKKQ